MNKNTCPLCFGAGIKLDDRKVGGELRAIRQRVGLRLGDIADRVGCSVTYLSDIETGRRHCPPRVRQAYDDIVKMSE